MIDQDEPAIYIYDNPEYKIKENINIYSEIGTNKGKDLLIKQMKEKKKNIDSSGLSPLNIIDNLEIEILSLVNDYKSNYLENKILLRDLIKKSSSIETKRICLIYLLGGGSLGYHFLNENGSLKSMLEIDDEIMNLLSWKGMSFNDYFTLNKIWKKMNYSSWVILKIMNRSQFVKSYLEYWFKNIYENKLSLTAASIFFLYYSGNTFGKIIKFIASMFIIGYLSIHLYEAFYTLEEVNIVNNSVDNLNNNNSIDKQTKKKILVFKSDYIKLENEIQKMKIMSDLELEEVINKQFPESSLFGLNKKKNKLNIFLLKYLQNSFPLSVFYMEMRQQGIMIPLAIYFFNNKGEVRPIRDIICSILIISKNFNHDNFSHLVNPEIVPQSRQMNLAGEFLGGSKNNKRYFSKKKQKHYLRKKTAKRSVFYF